MSKKNKTISLANRVKKKNLVLFWVLLIMLILFIAYWVMQFIIFYGGYGLQS